MPISEIGRLRDVLSSGFEVQPAKCLNQIVYRLRESHTVYFTYMLGVACFGADVHPRVKLATEYGKGIPETGGLKQANAVILRLLRVLRHRRSLWL
jgi:hypothetical protein